MNTIGSCLMISLEGFKLSEKEKALILSQQIAGVILFKRNLHSFQQIHALCTELKSLISPPLLIAIDMEGGQVNRFSHLNESLPWPSPKVLTRFQPKQIFSIAKILGKQIRLLGIDINFAPVVDLLLVDNPLLTSRVFGNSKESILKFASPFIEGLIEEKVIPCLKHFPGHGGVLQDSHKTLPTDKRSLEDLKSQLEIFQILFEKYSTWLMTAHVVFPKIENSPATFSKKLLNQELKQHRNFSSILVSDDIDMAALSHLSSGERFFQAILGGCNLILTCQKKESPYEIIKYFELHPKKYKIIKDLLKLSSQKLLQIRKNKPPQTNPYESVAKELFNPADKKKFFELKIV